MRPPDAVVLGASAGAIETLLVILPSLPATTPFPVVVVVHLPPNKPSLLASIFAPRCALRVREPEDKEPLGPGLWFAPPDYHLLLESDRTFAFSVEAPVDYSRPSIDVLFESAAEAYGAGLVAVVLTGANTDGAQGARAVRAAGGRVFVQDPESALAPTMPRAAMGYAELVAAPRELAAALSALASAPR